MDSNESIRILNTQNPPTGSTIWNFILECRDIITKHNTWEVNNEQSVSFWEDSWDGHPKLISFPHLHTIKEETSRIWANRLCNYGYVNNIYKKSEMELEVPRSNQCPTRAER